MSPRLRILTLVSVVAAGAAATAVGAALLQSRGAADEPALPEGNPPLVLDLGFREDDEARDLARAARLFDQGDQEGAAALFARHDSLQARIGQALARWPAGTVEQLETLAAERPQSGIVRLNLGFALFWAGRREEAVETWRETRRVDPDSLAAVRAADLLFPQFARGLPIFTPAGASGDVGRHLRAGVRFQRLGKQLSARREFDAAAELAPDDAQALVAAAVARFDKEDPAAAFSRLGPLTNRFPRATTVRFHLGLLLLWTGRVDEAKVQLRRARAIAPDDPIAREADRFLTRLESIESE